jgi:GNAT superfamily N-acetyltransferase
MRADDLHQDGLRAARVGSVREFPRRHGRTLADVWRTPVLADEAIVRVRTARLEDYAAIRALQRRALPFLEPLALRPMENRLRAFPEGQLIAVAAGEIVGAAFSLVVQWDDYGVAHTWQSITGDGYFTTHDTRGRTLYGADVAIDSPQRGPGIARALFQARRRLCRRLNLRRIIATARLPGYAPLRDTMTPELYAMRVIWGDIADSAMRFQMAQGYQYCGVLHGYQPEDTDSAGCAALLAWLNPMYAPAGPPAHEEHARQRKCA